MNYHDFLILQIKNILSHANDANFEENIKKGNFYDKLIRNYHQYNSNDIKVYRKKTRIGKHYKFTKAAYEKFSQDNKVSGLHFEHLIPLKIIKQKLLESDKLYESIKKILDENEIIILTKSQAKVLDKYFKSELPKRLNRIAIMSEIYPNNGYEIHDNTRDNQLFI
tara:strand:- start:189 stop:686 length:498 start_codon:yes stop_codon:yes gene_type:complete